MKMKLSEWAQIAEIISSAAILASLIFLVIQVSDNTRSVRAASAHGAATSLQAWYLEAGNNPQAASLFLHAITDPSTLTKEEEFQFYMSMHGIMLALQNSYFLGTEGALDQALQKAISGTILAVRDQPGFTLYWSERSSMFIQEFRDFIDGLEARGPIAGGQIYLRKDSAMARE